MPITTFELLSCVVIVVTLVTMALRRRHEVTTLLFDYVALALAGWVGEDSCIRLYRYYTYADSWHLRVDQVPLLVPLIWPLVILSARDFVDGVTGLRAHALPFARAIRVAALVALVVVFDAALIEVISVKAGYWSWAEPGHVGVPVFGVLGWGFFAWPAMTLLGSQLPGRHFLVIGLAPLAAHGLIFGTWQACFRWLSRADLGNGSLAGLGVLSLIATAIVFRFGRPLPLAVATPRLAATALFVVVFGLVARETPALWWCLGCAAVPYVVSMVPRRSTVPSPP